jgi:hypothetical protein
MVVELAHIKIVGCTWCKKGAMEVNIKSGCDLNIIGIVVI